MAARPRALRAPYQGPYYGGVLTAALAVLVACTAAAAGLLATLGAAPA